MPHSNTSPTPSTPAQEDSETSTPAHNSSTSQTKKPRSNNPKSSSSSSKPRLTASQKNTNHKDAENKRRNAIRERFTELSNMVPGTTNQERSEQLMLTKTGEFLAKMLREQKILEEMADERGVSVPEGRRLKESDLGGRRFRGWYMEEYERGKMKKGGAGSGGDGKEGEEEDGD